MPQFFSFWITDLGPCTASEASARGTARSLRGASHMFKLFEQPAFKKKNPMVLMSD